MLTLGPVTLLLGALAFITAEAQITKSHFGTITFNKTGDVVRATVYNPPLNLLDMHVVSDLSDFLDSISPGSSSSAAGGGKNTTSSSPPPLPPKVVIFASGDASLWLNHLDVNQFVAPPTAAKQAYLARYVALTRRLQALTSTVFVAEVDGTGWAVAFELALQMDLRYAGPRARLGSTENTLGIFAAAGGQLFLGQLAGKGRALEHNLAARAWDGPAGAAAGVFNGNFDSAGALRSAVDQTAARIALITRESINATKSALNGYLNPSAATLDADLATFNGLLASEKAQTLFQKFLKASRNQTSLDFELGGPDTYLALNKP